MDINWYIDGVCLNEELGIFFSSSAGVVDLLKTKKTTVADYPSLHGEEPDLSDRVYESRDLSFECVCDAPDGPLDLEYKLARLGELLGQKRLVRLEIRIDCCDPLVYMVYAPEAIKVKKDYEEDITATFTLHLREPNPVKRLYINTASSISISANSGEYPLLISYDPLIAPVKLLPTADDPIEYEFEDTQPHVIVVAGRLDIVELTCVNMVEICAYLN